MGQNGGKANCVMQKFLNHLEQNNQLKFTDYNDLHRWSVESKDKFWMEIIKYFQVDYSGSMDPSYSGGGFLDYSWFRHLRLNFAKNLLKAGSPQKKAILFQHESGKKQEITYGDLHVKTQKLAAFLAEKNVIQGDVVAAYMPNIPETIVSMLGTSSLGATFTSTSIDFGVQGVLDRFSEVKPKVLVTAISYTYNGKVIDVSEKILEVIQKLPSLESVILVNFLDDLGIEQTTESDSYNRLLENHKVITWKEIQKGEASELSFQEVSFSSPLYIMYSSGTTGKPKCIVHSVGGTLLQHIKELGLHSDVTEDKNLFYFTTCGWMMWNWLISGLYFGGTITLYEGSPAYPDFDHFLDWIDKEKVHLWGTSPKFLRALEKSDCKYQSKLTSLETVLSTGAPLLPDQFDFIHEKLKKDVHIASICGGTDIIGCFMLGNPLLPVKRGEIQCLGLGMDVVTYDDQGKEVLGEEGELICKTSFPSQPVGFLNDPDQEKFKKAYFDKYPDVWCHGDYITITESKGVIVYGRSDATLNPGGVRIGTAEIYRAIEQFSYIEDGLCVGKAEEGDVKIVLFLKLGPGASLDDEKIRDIKKKIRSENTPRHVPQYVFAVTDIPYTRSWKKMEVLVGKIINKKSVSSLEAVSNPECLEQYKHFFH